MAKVKSFRELLPFGSEAYAKADEWNHQVAFMEYVRVEQRNILPDVFAIPNGGTRNRVEAANMKMEGVTAGVPDILASFPSLWENTTGDWYWSHGLFIEMKRPTGSYGVSEKQEAFMQRKYEQGYCCVVAVGWVPAVAALRYYMGMQSRSECVALGADMRWFPEASFRAKPI